MGLKLGVFGFLPTTYAKTNAIQMRPRSLRVAVFYACLSSRSSCSRCRWHTHLTNHGCFDYGKNPKTPNLSPMPESRWHRFWISGAGEPEVLRRHLNFHQISHRFTSSFTNPSFQDLNGSHIMYWNMILNPSRFKVEPHSKYWYFCIERVDLLSLRFSENAVLFHI